jgi:DDE superfamily endonuclease
MKMFALYKNKKVGIFESVILLIDGHGSHLSIESLYIAAKNRIVVVCLLSHTTSVLQPNNRLTNKKLKALISILLALHARKEVTLTNYNGVVRANVYF